MKCLAMIEFTGSGKCYKVGCEAEHEHEGKHRQWFYPPTVSGEKVREYPSRVFWDGEKSSSFSPVGIDQEFPNIGSFKVTKRYFKSRSEQGCLSLKEQAAEHRLADKPFKLLCVAIKRKCEQG